MILIIYVQGNISIELDSLQLSRDLLQFGLSRRVFLVQLLKLLLPVITLGLQRGNFTFQLLNFQIRFTQLLSGLFQVLVGSLQLFLQLLVLLGEVFIVRLQGRRLLSCRLVLSDLTFQFVNSFLQGLVLSSQGLDLVVLLKILLFQLLNLEGQLVRLLLPLLSIELQVVQFLMLC